MTAWKQTETGIRSGSKAHLIPRSIQLTSQPPVDHVETGATRSLHATLQPRFFLLARDIRGTNQAIYLFIEAPDSKQEALKSTLKALKSELGAYACPDQALPR